MKQGNIFSKLIVIGVVGFVCLGLSYLVLGLTLERQSLFEAAATKQGINVPDTGTVLQSTTETGSTHISEYRKIVRSIKYSVLFFVVTFGCFFLFEILSKLRIHPIQYFLIGAALALFYLLLLAFAEYIGFMYAYLLSTSMILLLISGYSRAVLRSGVHTIKIFTLLAFSYGYLYVVLLLEEYALVFGSLIVFLLLATVMFYTRNIDWYEYDKGVKNV